MSRQSKVHLLKGVPLIKGTNHKLSFKGTSVYAYMNAKTFRSFNNVSYIRDGQVQLDVDRDEIIDEVNYMMFTNDGVKWFYCFIDSIEYIGERNTKITYTVDDYTTYKNAITIKGFVEREHCDYNVLNTVPEDVGIGDYISEDVRSLDKNTYGRFKLALVITTARLSDPTGFNGGIGISIDGTQQPYNYYLFSAGGSAIRMVDGSNSYLLPNLSTFNEIFSTSVDHANKIASIKIVEEVPFGATLTRTLDPDRLTIDVTGKGVLEKESAFGTTMGVEVVRLALASNYQDTTTFTKKMTHVRDAAKLNTYPFSFYQLVTGSKVMDIKKEYVVGDDITIVTKSTLDVDPQKAYIVNAYKGEPDVSNTAVENISVNMPVITENIATYLQSQTNTVMQGAISGGLVSAATMIGGVAMMTTGLGAGIGATLLGAGASGLGAVIGSLPGDLIQESRHLQKAKEMPNDVSGSIGKLIQFAINKKAYIMHKTQTPEYITLISDYFKRFGWKVMKNKTPNLTTRSHFNFVKMKDTIVTGNIPQQAKINIINLFNEGVTLWHTENIGDYTPNNTL